jgi:hypothetical protein
LQPNPFIYSILLPEIATHRLLYTNRIIGCVYLYFSTKEVRLMKLVLRTPGCTTWFPYPRTHPPLLIPTARDRAPPDINVRVDGLTDILAFCQFDAMTASFLKLHINSCFYYVSYDIFNIVQGRAFLACKKKKSVFPTPSASSHNKILSFPSVQTPTALLGEIPLYVDRITSIDTMQIQLLIFVLLRGVST